MSRTELPTGAIEVNNLIRSVRRAEHLCFLLYGLNRDATLDPKLKAEAHRVHLVDDRLESKRTCWAGGGIFARIRQRSAELVHTMADAAAEWIAVVRGYRAAVATRAH